MQRLIPALALVALMVAPAYAQTSNPPASANTNQAAQKEPLPLEIKQKLEKQGFTNVQVIPGSFLVSAKDKDGDPVNMLIGPNSLMVMTTAPVKASTPNNDGATGK
jgi:hypothetical protein